MARKVRTVMFDELHIAVRARHDITVKQRHQVLTWIRNLEQNLTDSILPNTIPEGLVGLVEIEVTK